MSIKNWAIRAFTLLLCLFLPKFPRKERFLLISTTALGDSIWATPTIDNIRAAYPHAHIAILASPICKSVLENNPNINAVIVLGGFFATLKKLRQERCDTAILLHASQRLVFPLIRLSGTSRRIATAKINKGLDHFFTHLTPRAHIHEIDRRAALLQAIGIQTPSRKLTLFLTQTERDAATSWLEKQGITKFVVVHPGAKDSFRRWPAEYFGEVAKTLSEQITVIASGIGAEKALLDTIGNIAPKVHILCGDLPFRIFAAVLEKSALLITNDTGPLHVGSALGRPLIALFCPNDPALSRPDPAPGMIILTKPRACTPCLKRKCLDNFCMRQFSPPEVIAKAKLLLKTTLM